MTTSRIQRGPMVAEVLERDYTRIGNRLIRDGRLDWPPKGVFMWMASHKDGFGVSPESIAAAGPGGVSAAKSALRQLEQHGYLIRRRQRRVDGTLGPSTYFITDMPENASGQQSPRSEPKVENPPVVEPPQVEPPVADDPHKKTIPMQEDHWVEDELSLPSEPDPVHEREMLSSFEDPDQPEPVRDVDVHTAQLANTDDTTQVTAAWVEAYKRSSNGSEPSVKAVSRVRTSAGSRLRAGKDADELALIAADMAETNLAWTDLAEHEAHWLHKQQQWGGLTGTDATVAGWLQLAGQLGGRQQHEPYRNDSWQRMEQQAAIGGRPDGWETVPFCGHLDCDEITRMRQVEDTNGLRSLTYCTACHPMMRF